MNTVVTEQIFASVFPAPSTVDALQAIAEAPGLSKARLDQLASHVRKAMHIQAVAAPVGHGPIRFTCEALNPTLWRRAPACYGFNAKGSFDNMVSSCRVVLTFLGQLDPSAELTPAWQELYERLSSERQKGLIRFMRFCSASALAPEDVENKLLDHFEIWCTTRQLTNKINALVRRTASNWTWAVANIPGWPQIALVRANMHVEYTIPLDRYPASFEADAKAFLDYQAADPVEKLLLRGVYTSTSKSPRSRPHAARPRTIEGHADHIRAAAAALVLSGTPIEAITSLRDLVWPLENFVTVVQFHNKRRKANEATIAFTTRPTHLLGIIETQRQIAKFHCRLDDEHVAEIAAYKAALTPETQGQMTEKNMARVRALLEPNTYARLLHLPEELVAQAEATWKAARDKASDQDLPPPAAAARLVMYAVAVEILLFCPLRRHNLVQLNLEKDLIRTGPRGTISRILVLGSKSKTGTTIDWAVPDTAASLIALWEKTYRPILSTSGNPYLFPGTGLDARNESEFGTYLGGLVEREIGAEFNMHLARHFSVVRFLRAKPGQYVVVSRLLGHKKVETTIRFYAGLEVDAAAEQANILLQAERVRTKSIAAAAFGGRRRKPRKRV